MSIKTSSGYGQQAQPATNDVSQVDWSQQMQQPFVQPTLKTLNSGYGQQQQLDQPVRISQIKFISLMTFICRKCPSKQAVVTVNKLNLLPMIYLK
jgi:hypothetical protein